ncbi:Bug family tripartite tricarboxylate transporter substrate binding protein [Salinicola peritrichatus]|uniref:Bug family tripartite tricarboxylate transporter substrate binding protein n=1 Tax=Salinicola peritrichatus TaxID=1267424 RepID=UPI001EF87CC3|nr:tripartite tricarboxylate transporter substrate-binding protein [Salinicola peritrichatus]
MNQPSHPQRRSKVVPKLCLMAACAWLATTQASAFDPGRNVECLAPSTPGGGWDFTCRQVANELVALDLVPAGVQTVNMPGASGAVAFSHVLSKRNSDDNLLVASSTAMASQLAQGRYPADQDSVKWIGTLGSDYGVIAVKKDSPIQDLPALMKAIQDDPKAIKFTGGSGAGGWDHLKVLMLAKSAGIKDLSAIPWLASNGGSTSITQVIGGHVEAYSGDISEAKGFIESGDLRVLAVLSPERLDGDYAEIPTAKEQGFDVIGPNWRGFYIPKGASKEAQAYWEDALNTIYDSDSWKAIMEANGLMPFHLSGDEFKTFLDEQIAEIRDLSQQIGLM